MNRLIFAIMFAIVLALSFVRVTDSNMSMTDDFQPEQSKTNWTEPTKWLSKVIHIFGEYKPAAGTVTLADTTAPAAPKVKKKDQTVAAASPTITPTSISRDGFNVSAVINPDSTDSSKAVAEITLTNPGTGTADDAGCPTCKIVFDTSISSDITRQQSQMTDLMNKVLAQAKTAKETGIISLSGDDDGGKHKKKKDDDDIDEDKLNADVAVNTCKAKKEKQNKDGDWITKGDYKTDPDGYDRCLQKMAKKFKSCMENTANGDDCNSVAGLDSDTVFEISRKLTTALPQAFQACLAAGDSCDRDVWSKWQDANPAQAMIAWHDYMASQYGGSIYKQAQQLSQMGPQGQIAAYSLLANNAQKILNDPNSQAHYQSDVLGYNAMRTSYAGNKPDSDDPHAAMANLAFNNTPQVYSPTDLTGAYSSLMGTVQKNALKAGYDVTTGQAVGQAQTNLAGANGLNPLTVQAVQAAGLRVCVVGTNGVGDGRDCDDRGRNYGTGALFSFDPTKDITDLGTIAFRLGQQNANLNTTGIANGSINGSSIPAPSTFQTPWTGNGTTNLNTGLSSSLQQNTMNMTTARMNGLRGS